jgi:hypothetical protein
MSRSNVFPFPFTRPAPLPADADTDELYARLEVNLQRFKRQMAGFLWLQDIRLRSMDRDAFRAGVAGAAVAPREDLSAARFYAGRALRRRLQAQPIVTLPPRERRR